MVNLQGVVRGGLRCRGMDRAGATAEPEARAAAVYRDDLGRDEGCLLRSTAAEVPTGR
ncbi:hypothetical protein [Nocardia sp. NPDC049707]|uniref:hypothetical protein n=1 Tax=Nocardia sp. NPDC049707 TaxID=3154735 RepID=UPI003432CD16